MIGDGSTRMIEDDRDDPSSWAYLADGDSPEDVPPGVQVAGLAGLGTLGCGGAGCGSCSDCGLGADGFVPPSPEEFAALPTEQWTEEEYLKLWRQRHPGAALPEGFTSDQLYDLYRLKSNLRDRGLLGLGDAQTTTATVASVGMTLTATGAAVATFVPVYGWIVGGIMAGVGAAMTALAPHINGLDQKTKRLFGAGKHKAQVKRQFYAAQAEQQQEQRIADQALAQEEQVNENYRQKAALGLGLGTLSLGVAAWAIKAGRRK